MIFRSVYFNVLTKNLFNNKLIVFKKNNFNIKKINKKAQQNRLLGENEPATIDITLSRVSHIINSIEIDSLGVLVDIRILDTHEGKVIKKLLENKCELFLIPRFIGEHFITFDFVSEDVYTYGFRKRFKLNRKLKKIKRYVKKN